MESALVAKFDKLLLLDIDETLVYSAEEPLSRDHDFQVGDYHVYKRPHLDSFLAWCVEKFRVGIWTSSSETYSNAIIAEIFRNPKKLALVWSRDRCTRQFNPESLDHFWIKDLKKIKKQGYDLEKVLIVDNTPKKLMRNYGNHIDIKDFEGDLKDMELTRLKKFLEELAGVDNVCLVEKRLWEEKYRLE